MNFKFKELQSVLFERGGWKPILTSMAMQSLLFVLLFVPFVFLLIMGTSTSGDPESFTFGLFAIFLLVAVVILIPFSVYVQAGLFGSIKDCVVGEGFSLKKYFGNGLTYFWKVLGFTILYTLFAGVGGFFIGLIAGFATMGESSYFLELFLTLPIGFLVLLISPIIYLSVIEGDTFSHTKYLYQKHGKEFLIVSAVCAFGLSIPVLNIPFSILVSVFGVYVMVLFFDFTEVEEVKEEVNVDFLEKEEE